MGMPSVFRQGLASVATALMNNRASVYGDACVASITIAIKVYLFVRNIILGMGQGFQPVAGYNYGAGNYKRTKESFVFTTVAGTVLCIIFSVLIAVFSTQIITWFRNDAEVIAIGRQTLLFACAVMPFMAYSTFVNQLYQCLGFKWQATVLASCRQGLCFFPVILLLPGIIGITGIEMSQPLSDFLTFLVSVPFQIVFFRKTLGTKSLNDKKQKNT